MSSFMPWPHSKSFAFTIIDDTDNATVENIRPVYDYLIPKGLKTTKTVWVYPSRNHFTGQCIQDKEYLAYLKQLENAGFEIQLHNVGSGNYSRKEILEGLELFNAKFDRYPSLQVNHASNPDNLYWGYKRYGHIVKTLMKLLKGKKRRFYGDEPDSEYFWGDAAKQHIRFIRNRVFNGINTLKYDPKMPYKEKNKPYANYWFSSSDGHTVEEFTQLIAPENINRLQKEQGACIVYTHFASGFVNKDGTLNQMFRENLDYLASQNGWFVPAGVLLNYLLEQKNPETVSPLYTNALDLRWLTNRVFKEIQHGR